VVTLVEFKRLIKLRASPRLFAAYDIYTLFYGGVPFTRHMAICGCMQKTRCADRALKSLVDSGLLVLISNPSRYKVNGIEQLKVD
jgi:hypothetical protein